MKMSISNIRVDEAAKVRETHSPSIIEDYAQEMDSGRDFPPVVVFFDGSNYWLADGYYRVQASKMAGKSEIEVEIRQGSQRDALLFAVGSNALHGLRRTNADKRRVVTLLLLDPEWGTWSNAEIA